MKTTAGTHAIEALMERLHWSANKSPLVFVTTAHGEVLGESVYRNKMHFEIRATGTAQDIRTADGVILHDFDSFTVIPGDTFDIEIGIS